MGDRADTLGTGAGPVLVCGATGDLGGRVARLLVGAGRPVRALVRPSSDASALAALGIDLVRGDLRDPETLRRAVEGAVVVITTATAIGRRLGGERGARIRDVDGAGTLSLVAAAEEAGVERFVYVSAAVPPGSRAPLIDAKRAVEARLAGSSMHGVVVRPDQFQEVWLSPLSGLDWVNGKATVFGKGDTPVRFVAVDDVAAAVSRLAALDDPPALVEFGGPEALSREGAIAAYERALGRPIRRRRVPRFVLRAAGAALRRPRPDLASLMGMALAADLRSGPWTDEPLRELGIDPRPAGRYIEHAVAAGGG